MKTLLSPYKRLLKLLNSDRKDIMQIYIYSLFIGLTNLSLPIGIQAIINFIQMGKISTSWLVLVFLVVGSIIFGGFLQLNQLRLTERLQQKIFIRSSFEFAYRIPRFQWFSIKNQYAPELVNRFFDTLTIQKGLPKILIDFSTALIQLFFGLILLSVYHPFFIIFSIVLLVVLIIILYLTGKKGLSTSIQESKYKYKVAFWLEEIARTMNTFRLAGKTELPLEKTNGLVNSYIQSRENHFKVLVFQYIQLIGFKALIAFFLLLIGGLLVINQQMNIGQFVAAEIIIILVIGSVEKLILNLENLYDVLTSIDKIGAVTDIPIERSGGKIILKTENKPFSVDINQLNFKFSEQNENLFEDFSLSIKSGQHTVIIGSDGSGKTTLLNLISNLYPIESGNISINQIPISNLDLEDLRTNIGEYVSQQQIFSGTIEENISMKRPEITMDEILWACEKTDLLTNIQTSKFGFQTELDPNGKNLSRTLSQKIILARCIVNRPKLLLIDDQQRFTSSSLKNVDHLSDLLFDVNAPWTLIAATKNESWLHHFKQIIKLEKGKIEFQGTYQEYKNKFQK